MAISSRENTLRAFRFEKPEWIPISAGFTSVMWDAGRGNDPEEIEDLLVSHPILFPSYQKGTANRVETHPDMFAGQPYTDGWGCVWETTITGLCGLTTGHPLADWGPLCSAPEGVRLDTFSSPDPEFHDGKFPLNWPRLREHALEARKEGWLVRFDLPHGHTYLRLQDLRGFENLMYDMMDADPRLDRLVDLIEQFNLALIDRFLALQPDIVGIPEDLGAQEHLVISPKMFRKYIKPSYLRMTERIKAHGVLVHEHSDGHILEIIDDLVDAGGDILNLQDLVNGIDNIARCVKGRLAIDLDIDRQSVTVTGSRQDIDDHIHECVAKLGSPEGGLSLFYQPWPPTSVENMRFTFDALEKYCLFYS